MLIRKMLRDMQQRKMQFVSVFLMAFLGLTLFSGLTSLWYGVEVYIRDFRQNTNLADVWVYSGNVSSADLAYADMQDGIGQAQRRLRLTADGLAADGSASGDKTPTLFLYFLEDNALNQPLVVEGAPINTQDVKSIWLDTEFARASGLAVGERYAFKIGGVTFARTIAGLVYSAEYTYYRESGQLWPDHTKIGFGYLAAAGFPVKDFILDRLESGDLEANELLDDMLSRKYPQFVDSAVDEHYDEMIDALVDDDYEGLIDEMVDENYDEIVDTLVEDNREEIINRYVDENYDEVIDRYVEENYDEILSEYVNENYDELLGEYVVNNRLDIIETYVTENYFTLLNDYIAENKDELIRAYVDENYNTLVNDYIDENFGAILREYVAANRNALISAYVAENFDVIVDDYIDANFDALLAQYVSANRLALLSAYAAENLETLAATWISLNFEAALDRVLYLLHTPEEIAESGQTLEDWRAELLLTYGEENIRAMALPLVTLADVLPLADAAVNNEALAQGLLLQYGEAGLKAQFKAGTTPEQAAALAGASVSHDQLRKAALQTYGEKALKQKIKQGISRDAVARMIKESLSDDDIRELVMRQFSVVEAAQAANERMSNAELISEAKKRYPADEVVALVKDDYPVEEVIGIARDEYTPEELKQEIRDAYTDDELKERVRENYPPDALKRVVREEYSPDDVKELAREHYPPAEMKTKLLSDYSADDMRELILEQYPGADLQEMLTESIRAMDAGELASEMVYNELLLKTARSDLPALEAQLTGGMENGVIMLFGRKDNPGVSALPNRMEMIKVISNVFPPVFIAIAVLTIITTMSRMVASQRTQIGTLKALGFSRGKTILHYLGYPFLASALGAFSGVLTGPIIVPRVLFQALYRVYTLPSWEPVILPLAWVIASACVIACTAASYIAVRDILRETPAESLRPRSSVRLNLRTVGKSSPSASSGTSAMCSAARCVRSWVL
jgi:uncharacterized membrane protein YheB (UPF0754 family)